MDAGFISEYMTTEICMDAVAILLSMDAGFILKLEVEAAFHSKMSQSYFQWMRVSYLTDAKDFYIPEVGRNPTFNGCGFHIMRKLLVLLVLIASQSYFQWMRVSYIIKLN